MTPDVFFAAIPSLLGSSLLFYPLNEDLIRTFKPCFDDYALSHNPHISNTLLKELGIKRRESHHIDEYVPLENVAVSTFLEQGTSPVSYLDTEMMSGELTAENLSVLLDKGYVFTYLELKPHYVNWTFKLYDLLYKTRHGIDYFLKINHFNNYYVLGLSYYK